jgi:cutinase
MGWRSRAAIVAASIVVLVVTPTDVTASTSADTGIPCTDVLFLGARGSGQTSGGNASDGGSGMGAQVYSAYQRLVSDLPGRSVTGVSVDYPATSAESLILDQAGYFSGLERGVRGVKGTLRRQVKACPDQRIVLAGFSQGGMVMHRALQDLAARKDATSRNVMRHIDSVLLLADGDRLPRDNTTDSGSAGPSRGISYSLESRSGVRGTRLPARFAPRVFSVCESADVVCDYHSLLQSNSSGVDGITIHATSYSGTPVVLSAADAAAARVR